jgi:hypothetical protein
MSSAPKVSYFNITGLGEPVRFMLAYSGVNFIDDRVDRDEWDKSKKAGRKDNSV